jgi:hypothetical protein
MVALPTVSARIVCVEKSTRVLLPNRDLIVQTHQPGLI